MGVGRLASGYGQVTCSFHHLRSTLVASSGSFPFVRFRRNCLEGKGWELVRAPPAFLVRRLWILDF